MFQRLFNWALLPLFLVALLTACGGGGSSSSAITTDGGTGSVVVVLSDAPADPSLFSAIYATIERVELIGADDERVPLFEGPAERVDLLKLRNESVPFVFRDDVPVGTFCKARLTLARPDGLELVLAADGSSHFPKLPGNGKLDLLARDCFRVAPGGSIVLQLDMDAGNSIHIVQQGNKTVFNFRPVVFIDVIDQDFTGKLVRLTGVIADYDATARLLLLCHALPNYHVYGPDCAVVEMGAESALFDNLTQAGDAAPLAGLWQAGNLNQPAAAVGLVRSLSFNLETPVIPADAWPADGLCLIWDPAVDAASQPYPDDLACNDPGLRLPLGLVLVDDQGVVVLDHRPRLALDGLAVETGVFEQLYGSAATDATADGFTLETPDPVTVALQNPTGYPGTRILSKQGALLDYTSILAPRVLKLDGVFTTASEFKAAVVIVDTERDNLVSVVGTVSGRVYSGFTLIPEEGASACGVIGDLTVVQTQLTERLATVSMTDNQVEVVPDGSMQLGDTVVVSGLCDSGSLLPGSIVIIDDQRIYDGVH